jgi:hypothetical protein
VKSSAIIGTHFLERIAWRQFRFSLQLRTVEAVLAPAQRMRMAIPLNVADNLFTEGNLTLWLLFAAPLFSPA